MTPLPKRRLSTARQGNRRAAFKIKMAGLSICPNCKKLKYGHAVCPECGYYNGKLVKAPKVRKEHPHEN